MAPNRFYSTNAIETTLVNPISNVGTSCSVVSITGYPTSTPFTIGFEVGTSNEEIAEVIGVAGTTFNINRGVDGSAALSHTAGAKVTHVISARDFAEPQAHLGSSTGVHGVTGSVVGTTDTQTLSGKTLTSPTINTPAVTGGTFSAPAITGGGSWAGSPSLTAPAISAPVITGGGSWAGSPTITAPTINTGGTWNGSPTLVTPTIASLINATHDHGTPAGGGATLNSPTVVTPTIASFVNANHDHSTAALGGNIPQGSVTGLSSRLTTDETNITNLLTPPVARLSQVSTQSIATSTTTAVLWDTELSKSPNSVHSTVTNPSRFTAPQAGLYQVSVNIPWFATGTGVREVIFQVNGTTSYAGTRLSTASAVTIVQSATHLIQLAANDYLEVLVWQNSGGAVTLDITYATGPRLTVLYVRQ